MAVSENVIRFFEIYTSSDELKARIENEIAMYPGSLEIREALAEDILLPIAEEMQLPFSLDELRAYETKKLLAERTADISGGEVPETYEYWLVNRGWENNEATFCSGEPSGKINVDKLFGI